MKRWLPDIAACTVMVAIALALYRKIVRLWWMYDDPLHLRILGPATLRQILFPRPGQNPLFTPLLMLSLKCDLVLFGLDARMLYIHQLISLSILLIVLYALLRLWCSPLSSAAAGIVAMTGGPSLPIVPLLMTRHYIEGAIWAVLATITFVIALRRDKMSLAVLSAVLYLAAAASKEIFVPLPALLFVIPNTRGWKRRAGLVVPHALAAVAYATWRVAAVGLDVAPYGPVPENRWQAMATLPLRILRQFAPSGSPAAWILAGMILMSVALVLARVRGARPLAIVGVLVSILPILPVSAVLEPRWMFSFWLLAIAAIAFLPQAVPRAGTALAMVVAVVSLAAFRSEWTGSYRRLVRMSDEARVLALLGPADIVRNPLVPPTTMLELKALTGTPASAFYDDFLLCNPNWRVGRVFEYDLARREVTERGREDIDRTCHSIVTKPILVRIHFDSDGAMHWIVGPYTNGSWTFILVEGVVAYDVPRQGGFRWGGLEHFTLRVRYQSRDGWRTYSPPLPIDIRKGPVVFNRS